MCAHLFVLGDAVLFLAVHCGAGARAMASLAALAPMATSTAMPLYFLNLVNDELRFVNAGICPMGPHPWCPWIR